MHAFDIMSILWKTEVQKGKLICLRRAEDTTGDVVDDGAVMLTLQSDCVLISSVGVGDSQISTPAVEKLREDLSLLVHGSRF